MSQAGPAGRGTPADVASARAGTVPARLCRHCRRAAVEVQTVLIGSSSLFLGTYWRLTRMPRFLRVYLVPLGRRFAVEGEPQVFAARLGRHVRAELAPAALEGR